MKVKKIVLVKRQDGNFMFEGRKISAIKKGDGYGVAITLESSPIDKDFGVPILFLSEENRKQIIQLFDESDKLTAVMIGHDWKSGPRPFCSKTKAQNQMYDMLKEHDII
jgi:hypothetical protein